MFVYIGITMDDDDDIPLSHFVTVPMSKMECLTAKIAYLLMS